MQLTYPKFDTRQWIAISLTREQAFLDSQCRSAKSILSVYKGPATAAVVGPASLRSVVGDG